MMRSWALPLCALVLAGTVFFTNLGRPRLWDRDEPRNAGCAWEMLQRHDWVVPVFNGELRDHKPVLLYWFMMAAYSLFGVNEFSARLFSALFGLGTILLVYDLGRRWFRPQVGFWAAIMLATCMMFPVAARAATPDSLLIFFATAALWAYAGPLFAPPGSRAPKSPDPAETGSALSWAQLILCYGAMGLAVLAKGPIGFVLPAGIIGLYHMIEGFQAPRAGRGLGQWLRTFAAFFHPRRIFLAAWKMRLGWGLAIMLAVAGPWYFWVGVRTDGEWLRGFLLTHNVGRFLQPMENHSGPIIYYPLVLLVCFFPWAWLLLPGLYQAVREARRGSLPLAIQFLLIWGGAYLGFFSLAGTKLPNYITPALPAFALVTAWWLDGWLRDPQAISAWVRGLTWWLMVCGALLAIAIPLAARIYLPGEEGLGLLGLIWIAGGVSCLLALRRGQRLGFAVALATTAWVFAVSVFGLAAVRVSQHQQFGEIVALVQQLQRASGTKLELAAYDCLEPSWVFYAGQTIKYCPASEKAELIERLRESPGLCVLMTHKRYNELRKDLPESALPLGRIPYYLKKNTELILVAGPKLVATLRRSGSDVPGQPRHELATGPGENFRR